MASPEAHVDRVAERDPAPVRLLGATVSPEELRKLELRESVRGYHRREVEALCARAAETIEHLQRRQRALEARLARGPKPRRADAVDADVIQRTLILAQRVADQAVSDAESRAEALLGDAETRASTLVTEAESEARRVAASERRRVEAEVVELVAARDALTADLDVLEQFAVEYRDRIRHAIEAELERIGITAGDLTPGPRPPGVAEAPSGPPTGPAALLPAANAELPAVPTVGSSAAGT